MEQRVRTSAHARVAACPVYLTALGIVTVISLAGCGGGDDLSTSQTPPPPAASTLKCDNSMKTAFQPDSNTSVLFVKEFKAGESIALSGTPPSPTPATAPHGLCLVKLNIGPGNPGPTDAPSTSAGIGVEVWLPDPAVWSKRLQLNGTGGYAGMPTIRDTTVIGSSASLALAINDKAVSAETDHGHVVKGAPNANLAQVDASFGMKPDGSINTTLLKDFADRAVHEMTVKVKALAAAYYGAAPTYSYFIGCSGGGRDGYSLAQLHPEHYDGILIGAPGIQWTRWVTSQAYPQIVMQRDLAGAILTADQRLAVSAAAVSACDANLNGQHDGFISDLGKCRYDSTKDASVLCTSSGGTNATAACLSTAQARAVNKMWYGPTADGTVPDPASDLGLGLELAQTQLWYGPPRGSDLSWTAGGQSPAFNGPFPIAFTQLALNLQNPSVAIPMFTNATGNGQDGWKTLTYGQLADAHYQGLALQPLFGNMNAENPDLSAFKQRGGKLLVYQGMDDPLLPAAGLAHYYTKSANITGGFVETQTFHRLFFVPGMGHCAGPAMSGIAGISPPAASNTPLPNATQLFGVLKDWVEKNATPETIVVTAAGTGNSRPLCLFPKKITYVGGDTKSVSSYACM